MKKEIETHINALGRDKFRSDRIRGYKKSPSGKKHYKKVYNEFIELEYEKKLEYRRKMKRTRWGKKKR